MISPKPAFKCEERVHWRKYQLGNLILSGVRGVSQGKECLTCYLKRDKELDRQEGGRREGRMSPEEGTTCTNVRRQKGSCPQMSS